MKVFPSGTLSQTLHLENLATARPPLRGATNKATTLGGGGRDQVLSTVDRRRHLLIALSVRLCVYNTIGATGRGVMIGTSDCDADRPCRFRQVVHTRTCLSHREQYNLVPATGSDVLRLGR